MCPAVVSRWVGLLGEGEDEGFQDSEAVTVAYDRRENVARAGESCESKIDQPDKIAKKAQLRNDFVD
jgi:hypothetical protein